MHLHLLTQCPFSHTGHTAPRSPTTSQQRSARRLLSVLLSSILWSPTSSPGSAARRMSRLGCSSGQLLGLAFLGCRKTTLFRVVLLPRIPAMPTFLLSIATLICQILLLPYAYLNYLHVVANLSFACNFCRCTTSYQDPDL